MEATLRIDESPREAARRLFQRQLQDGFRATGLYPYTDSNGAETYWRVRLDHPTEGKYIRPFYRNGADYMIGEPEFEGGKPLYKQSDIAAQPNAVVWIVEGEKCVDALSELDLVVTTSGSCSSAKTADWSPLAGREVVIWPDNDESGLNYAADVVSMLGDIAADVRVVDVAKLDLPATADAADWVEMNPTESVEGVRNLPTTKPAKRESPLPLRRELPLSEPFPTDSLGELLGPAARRLHETIQAPEAMCGQSVLAAACLVVQPYADLSIDGRRCPVSENFVSVGASGERKSAVDRQALWPVRKHQRNLVKQYQADLVTYQNDRDIWEQSRKEALGTKNKPKKEALNNLGVEPSPPLHPYILVEEPTYEGLVKQLNVGQPSVGLFSDEGGRLLGGHGMTQENQIKTAAGLSGLWDGKEISRVRAGDGSFMLYGRRCTMHLMIQPDVSRLLLSNATLIDQGLISRCLVAWPESTAGSRHYAEVDLTIDPANSQYGARLLAILETPPNLAEGQRNELDPRAISFTSDAKALWVRFHDYVEQELGSERAFAPIRGFANKAPEHAARLSAVLALIDDVHRTDVPIGYVKAGIELAKYYLSEALRLHHAGVMDPDLILAEKLLAWSQTQISDFSKISSPTAQNCVYLSQIYQLGPNAIRDSKTAMRITRILERHGWFIHVEGGMSINGSHRKDVWKVNK